jgi:hypothetical protein
MDNKELKKQLKAIAADTSKPTNAAGAKQMLKNIAANEKNARDAKK